jgi:hypothetical protein
VRSADSKILSTIQSVPPDIDLSGALLELTASPFARSAPLGETCGLLLGGDYSSFLIVGRGGTPIQPGGLAPTLDLAPFKLDR